MRTIPKYIRLAGQIAHLEILYFNSISREFSERLIVSQPDKPPLIGSQPEKQHILENDVVGFH